MKKLPISLGWKPSNPIRIDKLPPLGGEITIHIHRSEGENKAHLKLEYGDTPYCLSLFVFDLNKFLRNEKVKVRSYDLWEKKIMYAAPLAKGGFHPKYPGFIYRDDAVILDWGRYKLENGIIEISLETLMRKLRFKIIFYGIRKYYSPKYGWSVRSEYIFEPAKYATLV